MRLMDELVRRTPDPKLLIESLDRSLSIEYIETVLTVAKSLARTFNDQLASMNAIHTNDSICSDDVVQLVVDFPGLADSLGHFNYTFTRTKTSLKPTTAMMYDELLKSMREYYAYLIDHLNLVAYIPNTTPPKSVSALMDTLGGIYEHSDDLARKPVNRALLVEIAHTLSVVGHPPVNPDTFDIAMLLRQMTNIATREAITKTFSEIGSNIDPSSWTDTVGLTSLRLQQSRINGILRQLILMRLFTQWRNYLTGQTL